MHIYFTFCIKLSNTGVFVELADSLFKCCFKCWMVIGLRNRQTAGQFWIFFKSGACDSSMTSISYTVFMMGLFSGTECCGIKKMQQWHLKPRMYMYFDQTFYIYLLSIKFKKILKIKVCQLIQMLQPANQILLNTSRVPVGQGYSLTTLQKTLLTGGPCVLILWSSFVVFFRSCSHICKVRKVWPRKADPYIMPYKRFARKRPQIWWS